MVESAGRCDQERRLHACGSPRRQVLEVLRRHLLVVMHLIVRAIHGSWRWVECLELAPWLLELQIVTVRGCFVDARLLFQQDIVMSLSGHFLGRRYGFLTTSLDICFGVAEDGSYVLVWRGNLLLKIRQLLIRLHYVVFDLRHFVLVLLLTESLLLSELRLSLNYWWLLLLEQLLLLL